MSIVFFHYKNENKTTTLCVYSIATSEKANKLRRDISEAEHSEKIIDKVIADSSYMTGQTIHVDGGYFVRT